VSVELTVVAHPVPGTIVRVDLSEGFRVPEIGKRRPCIVLSPPLPGRSFMCSIVPLSTSHPKKVSDYHTKLTFDPLLPEPYDSREMWVKGDIVLTVAFHRLRLIFSGWNSGQRVYDVRVLDEETLEKLGVESGADLAWERLGVVNPLLTDSPRIHIFNGSPGSTPAIKSKGLISPWQLSWGDRKPLIVSNQGPAARGGLCLSVSNVPLPIAGEVH
jgi:mRNA interferase MazF